MLINKMVKKQVEKQMAEMRAEFLLSLERTPQMAAWLKKWVREPVEREARENSQHYTLFDPGCDKALDLLVKMVNDLQESTDEEEDEEIPLGQMTLSSSSSEAESCTNLTFDKSTKCDLADIWFDACDVSETSAPVIDSAEEEAARNMFYSKFMAKNQKSEEKGVFVDDTEEDEALLESEGREWMDTQELTRSHNKETLQDIMATEKQGGARPFVSKKKMKQNPKAGQTDTIKKIRTHLSDFFSPHRFSKWEKLEDED